jgi:hypothetical protein
MEDRADTDPLVAVGVSDVFNRRRSICADASYLSKTEVSLLSFGARLQFSTGGTAVTSYCNIAENISILLVLERICGLLCWYDAAVLPTCNLLRMRYYSR